MKAGYIAELTARKAEFEDHKLKLEGLYMNNHEEQVIEQDPILKGQFDEAAKAVDKLLPTFANTMKSVKMAVETQLFIFGVHIRTHVQNITLLFLDTYGLIPSLFLSNCIAISDHFKSRCWFACSEPSESRHMCYCKDPPKPKPKGKAKAKQ